ncbi:Protein FAM50 [Nymphon striatum]|nr:Protein FAM50 [Nymphon striatum]
MAQYKGAASEGGRAMQLKKKREKKIEVELKLSNMDNKFASHYDEIEAQLKSSTIGLVTLDEMKAKQEDIVNEREKQLAKRKREKEMQKELELHEKKEKKRKQMQQIASLSFNPDEEEEDDGDDDDEKEKEEEEEENNDLITEHKTIVKKKIGKDPNVDTSFLPDREREEEENRMREELRMEWVKKQNELKNEEISITFSYWDGSGHRRSVIMKKGNSIYQFLQRTLELLRKEFNELKVVTADQLMYIKEDLIIPHSYSFYDFIVVKARGKSGPLFSFDVHEDVRIVSDASVEKNESHAGKVVLRSWYERSKHIFPASRWEPYDPEKNYEKYTVSDKSK